MDAQPEPKTKIEESQGCVSMVWGGGVLSSSLCDGVGGRMSRGNESFAGLRAVGSLWTGGEWGQVRGAGQSSGFCGRGL